MKAISRKLKRWSQKHPAIVLAIYYTAFCHLMDLWASSLSQSAGILESNPFARSEDGTANIPHLFVVKLLGNAAYGLLAWVGWEGIARFNKRLADAAVVVWLVYCSSPSLDAAINNLMFHWRWYVAL